MLITPQYAEELWQVSKSCAGAFTGGGDTRQYVLDVCGLLNTEDVLDYGCGKGDLAASLPFKIKNYDPGVPMFADRPEPVDVLVCHHVLEHIEPECLDEVLDHLRSLTKKVGLFWVPTFPGGYTLPDGRDSHLSLHEFDWWASAFRTRWDVRHIEHTHNIGPRFYEQGKNVFAVVQPWILKP